jgi:hypothetical protein
VDYVLLSDSTIKAATNSQQWYVTISRGRRGIHIFTPDKAQLRENVTRSGHRPLAIKLAAGFPLPVACAFGNACTAIFSDLDNAPRTHSVG